jgi:2-polyprenyl-6-methoxyphenol hydroxylase-like FAD-dependent oxidoreductase
VSLRAVVIGCGIGGATAALALAEIGASVEVYEATARPADRDGWVTLGPAAMTGLDRVGVADAVWAVGFPVVSVRTVDTAPGGVTDFSRYESTHRFPSTHVWRCELLCILRDRLDTVGVTCHYGSTAIIGDLDADVIVGADGVRSATRRSIGNLAEPTYTGQIIRYGHHPRPAPHLPTGVLHFWRHSEGVAGYVGDLRDGSFWFNRHNSDTPTDVIDQETAIAALRDTPVHAVLDTSWVSRSIVLNELEPKGRWRRGHTVVIGDAPTPCPQRPAEAQPQRSKTRLSWPNTCASVPTAFQRPSNPSPPVGVRLPKLRIAPVPASALSPSRPTNSI